VKPDELKKMLSDADQECEKIGLGKCNGLSLVWVKDTYPQGYKVRTPFGNCDILQTQEINGQYQTVFRVSRKQILNYLKKVEAVS
jgi:hypothetical protein